MIARGFSGRALRFQLTALVDLLLIMLFMQFLELREYQEVQEVKHEARLREVSKQATLSQQEMESAQAILRDSLDESRSKLEESEALARSYQVKLDKSVAALQSAFASLKSSSTTDSAAVDAIAKKLEVIASASPEEVIRFLVGYDELLKRAEVWVLHVRRNGEIALQVGEELRTFRLEESKQTNRSSEFADRLFATYKQLRQPKGLVVILSSYDLRATAGVYQSMIDGLPKAIDRMRNDSPSIRFEFSVLGPMSDPTIQNSQTVPSE